MTRNKMSNDGKYFTTGGIIVTGCSRGIGETMRGLCKLNQNIIISGRNRKDLNSVAIKCNDKNPKSKCIPVAGDVTDSKHLKDWWMYVFKNLVRSILSSAMLVLPNH